MPPMCHKVMHRRLHSPQRSAVCLSKIRDRPRFFQPAHCVEQKRWSVPTLARDLRNHPQTRCPMTPQQIELVQSTWRKVLPVRDTAAELFYGKLFSLDASLRALFKDDMQEQGRNLAAMISIVVSG